MTEKPSFPIVDAHQHFWNLEDNYYPWLCDLPLIGHRYGDYSAIKKTYLPEDFRRDTAGWNVVHTVHVQADWDPVDPVGETRWLTNLAKTHGLPSACVAHVELDSPTAVEVIEAQAAYPIVRGIRHKPAAVANPQEAKRGAKGSMDDSNWRVGFEALSRFGLSYDLQTPWWHLDAAHDLAQNFPQTAIIINHAALPGTRDLETLRAWRHAIEAAANADNILIKISGLGLPRQRWSVNNNGAIVRHLVSAFGAERCIFGSNFPVDGLMDDYGSMLSGMLESLQHLQQSELKLIFHENACRVYRIPSR